MTASKVINIWADEPDLGPLLAGDDDVQTIVIGDSPTNSSATVTAVPDLPAFETEYRRLTHLYLWSTSGAKELPTLPLGQQILEIRRSQDLATIHSLPSSLESIVIEDCPLLDQLPAINGRQFRNLRELSLVRCPQVDAEWINDLIRAAPHLELLDLSGCSQVQRLATDLPYALDRLELNGCTGITALPDPLPLRLRRVGVRGAKSLDRLPELPDQIDYIDLAFTESLRTLPRPKGKPRTLFLFGSAVLEPPASEHGAAADTNVAAETSEYWDEVDLVGKGTVKRCKLLLLGNGEAGKTMLALNLLGLDKRRKKFDAEGKNIGGEYTGSTHGIQFWDWPNYDAGTNQANIHLNIWDFGGQEIYHSSHRLFVSRGSVFVVVWKPDQDDQQPPARDGVQDVWHPVRYWLDYIHAECPYQQPLIAVVCSHQANRWQHGSNPDANRELKRELAERFRHNVGDAYANAGNIRLYVLDSEHDIGERTELENWLRQSVGKVIESQGTVVPTYWEIAQDMVEKWLGEQKREAAAAAPGELPQWKPEQTRMSLAEFTERLGAAIDVQLQQPDRRTSFDRLRAVWNDEFLAGNEKGKKRVQRTLRFLTHSGWLYWAEELFDSRVIINQAWALEKVYACLERRQGTSVYRNLTEHEGRFTFQQLRDWCRELKELPEKDQHLIMTFMESVGVCFRVARHWHSDRGDTDYISPTHLPQSDQLCASFQAQHPGPTEDNVASPQLHRGHWFAMLRGLCRIYGDEATYTRDACLVRHSGRAWNRGEQDWTALLQFRLHDHDDKGRTKVPGLGGQVVISSTGPQAADGLGKLKEFVESFLPGYKGNPSAAVSALEQDASGCRPGAKTVFFSYAWDPIAGETHYVEPVDAIERALLPLKERGLIKDLLRDKSSMEPGDYIVEFVDNVGSQQVDLVLVFTSDRYWKSWWCMLEFRSLIKSMMRHPGRSLGTSLLLIEHDTGKIFTARHAEALLEHWNSGIKSKLVDREFDQVPESFPQALNDLNWRKLRVDFLAVLNDPNILGATIGLSKDWSPEHAEEIIAWVKEKLQLPADA